MKKIIISFLIILIIGLFISNRNNTYNKKYIDYNNNIFIEFPFFNNDNIDNYLNDYINNFTNKFDYLFIDYDFTDNNNLTMYVYRENNNMVKYTNKRFYLNKFNNAKFVIKESNDDISYNFFTNKLVNKDKLIALTFDDGPNHNTINVLNILEKYNISATFFILGTNIDGNEKIIKRMNELGMEIGNHMYSHSITTRLSNDKIKEEINKTDELVYNIIGKYPSLIRPSYGIYNKNFQKLIDRPIVLWNIDTLDWKYHNSKGIANRVFKNINRGNIILMHDIYNATANSLEIIIPKLLDEGYKFVTVSELLV